MARASTPRFLLIERGRQVLVDHRLHPRVRLRLAFERPVSSAPGDYRDRPRPETRFEQRTNGGSLEPPHRPRRGNDASRIPLGFRHNASPNSSGRVMSSSRRTGCPARCGSIPSAAISRVHRLLQRVVPPLHHGAGVLGPPRPGQRVDHRLGRGRAPGGQVTLQPPRPAERPGEPDRPVGEPVSSPPGRRAARRSSSATSEVRQVRAPPAPVSSSPSACPARRRGGVGPVARSAAAHDTEIVPSASAAASDAGAPARPAHPAHLRPRGRAGSLGLPGQPHPRRPVPVAGQPAARHAERRQHPRVRRRLPRLRHRQRPQAISLQPLGPGGRIIAGQVVQRRRQRAQRLRRSLRPRVAASRLRREPDCRAEHDPASMRQRFERPACGEGACQKSSRLSGARAAERANAPADEPSSKDALTVRPGLAPPLALAAGLARTDS